MANSVISSRSPLVAELINHNRRSYAEQVNAVEQRVGDRALAELIVSTARGQVAELTPYFYVNTVRFAWDTATGTQITADYTNYIDPRVSDNPKV